MHRETDRTDGSDRPTGVLLLLSIPMWRWPFATPFFRAATASYVLAVLLIIMWCGMKMESARKQQVRLQALTADR